MEEFNNIEKVTELFKSIDGLGQDNAFFIACQDKQHVSGMVAGMEYPYDGLLINCNENGLAIFYLKNPLGGLIGLSKAEKMKLAKDQHIFIPTENIENVTIKKFALLNSKVKRVTIDTADGKSHKLYARLEEKEFPYHKDGFAKFINKYSK